RLFNSGGYSTKDELQFFKSKILKNGSISQGSHLDRNKVLNQHSHQEIKSSDDLEIIAISSTIFGDSHYRNKDAKLSGKIGAILIKEMIKTRRCFFDNNKYPLTFSKEVFRSEFEFKLHKGVYSLKPTLDTKIYKIVDSNPLIIIDTLENIVYEMDIDNKLYKQLLDAPKVAKKDIGYVYTSIGKQVPNIELKTPKAIKTIQLDIKPRAKIALKYIKNENEKNFNSFIVDFKYDDYTIKYEPQNEINFFYKDNSKIELKRDLEFENRVKRTIEEYGFNVSILDENITVQLTEYNKQGQLKVWKKFLHSDILELEKEGWIVEYDEEFALKFETDSTIVVDSEDKNGWFNLSFNFEFNGVSQPIAPLVVSIVEEFDDFENMPQSINIEVSENHFVEVPTKQMKPIIKTIIELLDKQDKKGNIKVSAFDAHLIDFTDEDIQWRGSKDILEFSKKLKNFKGITKVEPSKVLNASLRDYQQDGLNWLQFLFEFNFGGILADDMGLGKTIQTLAHLSKLKEDGKLTGPSLIVMPTSLIANWKNEVKKFTPNLSVLSLHGTDRAQRFKDIQNNDILLTTYPLIVRDKEIFDEYKFFYIILDEAQKIKNPKTKMTIAIKTLKSEHRLALSGTPIENHLGELWSIYSFLMPGFLDTLSFFKKYYQLPIEKDKDFQKQNLLNKRVKPFMIRRTKEKVAHELPAKTEIIKYTQFEDKQSKLYESIRVTMEKKVREAVSNKGLGSSHITILDALLKLRQVCCDPSLLSIDEAKKVHDSAKLELFLDLIAELLEEGRKILVFSQFTTMLAIIEEKIKQRDIKYTKLTGSTKDREGAIEKFTKGEADIFLISLKAGGVGLNLVEADTVIHYDPWWNPAVENQATDRAYRIGQKKAVFVYKLIVENTIEQKILEMQKRKQALQDGIYDGDKQQEDVKFSGDELLELLK
ncbi:MAG: DEAD/DEAH box helicase, partial [Campylobacterota bacterium]|nr:DEAD/DEAH box helicase [Campylobacterota bacterium]